MFHSTHGPALGWMLVGVLIVFAPWLSERVRLPGVIGLLVGGALIGAHGLDLISNPAVLQSVGSFGLLYLMFLAGLELDLAAFAARVWPAHLRTSAAGRIRGRVVGRVFVGGRRVDRLVLGQPHSGDLPGVPAPRQVR